MVGPAAAAAPTQSDDFSMMQEPAKHSKAGVAGGSIIKEMVDPAAVAALIQSDDLSMMQEPAKHLKAAGAGGSIIKDLLEAFDSDFSTNLAKEELFAADSDSSDCSTTLAKEETLKADVDMPSADRPTSKPRLMARPSCTASAGDVADSNAFARSSDVRRIDTSLATATIRRAVSAPLPTNRLADASSSSAGSFCAARPSVAAPISCMRACFAETAMLLLSSPVEICLVVAAHASSVAFFFQLRLCSHLRPTQFSALVRLQVALIRQQCAEPLTITCFPTQMSV